MRDDDYLILLYQGGLYLKGVALHLDCFPLSVFNSLVCEVELLSAWVTAMACAASSFALLSL